MKRQAEKFVELGFSQILLINMIANFLNIIYKIQKTDYQGFIKQTNSIFGQLIKMGNLSRFIFRQIKEKNIYFGEL